MLIIRQLKPPTWLHHSSYCNSVSIATPARLKPTFTLPVLQVAGFLSPVNPLYSDIQYSSSCVFRTALPSVGHYTQTLGWGQRSKRALLSTAGLSVIEEKRQFAVLCLRLGRGCSRLRASPSCFLHPPRRRNRSGARWAVRPTAPRSGCRRRWPCPSGGGEATTSVNSS